MHRFSNKCSAYIASLGVLFSSFTYGAVGSSDYLDYRNDALYELVTLHWPPYVFINDGKPTGYDVEVVTAAFDAVNSSKTIQPDLKINIEIDISILPWKRAVLSAELGRYIGLFPEYYDKSRKAKFTFSKGYPGSRLYFFKLKSNDFSFPIDHTFKKASDFKLFDNRSVGIVRGYINTTEFDKANNFKKIEVSGDLDLLELLCKKRVDLVVMDNKVMEYIKKSNPSKFDGVELVSHFLGEKEHYIGFANAHYLSKQAIADFNHGLRIIKNNGVLKNIMDKYKIK